MDPRDKSYTLVFLPYLKTRERVYVGDLEFRPAGDLDGLTADVAQSATELSEMLFLLGNQRIERPTFAVTDRLQLDRARSELQRVGDVEAVIAYLYASPRLEFNDLFLSPEHANTALFTPDRVPSALVRETADVIDTTPPPEFLADAERFVDGFHGLLGLQHHLWVARGSRVYATIPRPTLNGIQDLRDDVAHASRTRVDYRLLFDLLRTPDRGGDLGRRVLNAVRWFNRANSEHRGRAESLVNLSIALETLLRVPRDDKTARFVDAIALLLGRVPRLDAWAAQFYDARSKVIHEGDAADLAYERPGGGKGAARIKYQSLLAYGREVFQLCVGALLTGASLAARADLAAKLVTNSERFEQVSKLLDDDSRTISDRLDRLSPLAHAIRRYRYVPDSGFQMKSLLGACRAAARVSLASDARIGGGLRSALETLASAPRESDCWAQLDALRKLMCEIENLGDRGDAGIEFAAISLIEDTWHYVYSEYYRLRRVVRDEVDRPDE